MENLQFFDGVDFHLLIRALIIWTACPNKIQETRLASKLLGINGRNLALAIAITCGASVGLLLPAKAQSLQMQQAGSSQGGSQSRFNSTESDAAPEQARTRQIAQATPATVGLTSNDVLRRYMEGLASRLNIAAPPAGLLTRQELGDYFMTMMQKISGLPTSNLTERDFQEIGFLTDEFEDVYRIVKGKLAVQVFKNDFGTAAIPGRIEDHSLRLGALERTKVSGDFCYLPQQDWGRTDRASMAVNLRSRINFNAKVVDAEPNSKLGDGYLFTRLTAAAGRFFPRNKYLLSPLNDVVDANASPFNSGPNEVQIPTLIINNNNSNSLRPTVSLEQVFYTQNLNFGKKWKSDYKAGLISFGNMFDSNNFANSDSLQFLNTGFVNSISWRANFNGPAVVVSAERSLFRDKAFLRGTAGMTTIGNRDYFGSVGFNYEAQFGHKFYGKEGNLRAGLWNFNFRGGSENPFVTPIDISGTSLLSLIPGGTGYGSQPVGMYMNFDQKVWKNIGLFGRYALNDKQIGEVFLGGLLSSRGNWSIGSEIPISSFSKKRKDDVIGIAYGQTLPYSREAVQPATPAFVSINGGPTPTTVQQVQANLAQIIPGNQHRTEKVLEAYYRFHINKNVSISPDIQYIWSPGGVGPQPGVFALGSRLYVQF